MRLLEQILWEQLLPARREQARREAEWLLYLLELGR